MRYQEDRRIEFVCMCCMEYHWRKASPRSGWICPYRAKNELCPVVEHVYLREQDEELSWVQMGKDLEKNIDFNMQREKREAQGIKTVHRMKLLRPHFEAVKQGVKTVEMRLDDAKRRWVRVGDLIEFCCADEQQKTVLVEVLKKTSFVDFAELTAHYNSKRLGFELQSKQEICDHMKTIYDERKLKASHVLAIEFALLEND